MKTAMDLYVERVVEEHEELVERLEKLSAFVSSSLVFKYLPEEEQALLVKQEGLLTSYRDVLAQRILLMKKAQLTGSTWL
jgi:hypothetical protein